MSLDCLVLWLACAAWLVLGCTIAAEAVVSVAALYLDCADALLEEDER